MFSIQNRSFFFKIVLLFFLGAVFGSLGDLCHVHSGTEGYPALYPALPGVGLPFWVPLLFGSANVAIALSHTWADKIIGPTHLNQRPGMKSPKTIAAALALLLITWAASGFVPLPTGGAKDVMMLAVAFVMWITFDRTWQGLFLGSATAVLGTAFEINLVRNEIFFYLSPSANFFGVPSWLPLLYFSASIAVGNLSRAMRL